MVIKLRNEVKESLIWNVFNKAARNRIPLQVTLELTYRCNLACQHCYVPLAGTDELSFSEVCAILDQLHEVGTVFTAFTGGEIFIRKDFLEILQYARSKNFIVAIQTNGTLIDSSVADELRNQRVSLIEMSLYGATSKTHDCVTQVVGSFKKTINSIGLLIDAGVPLRLKSPQMSLNVHECAETKSLADRLAVPLAASPRLAPAKDGNKKSQELSISHDQFRIFAAQFPAWVNQECSLDNEGPERLLCKAGTAVCSITPEGKVNPCVMMPLEVGDLRARKFQNIWFSVENQHLNKLRSIHPKEIFCTSCNRMHYCVRCPGVAYMENGDFYGRSPSACQIAEWCIDEMTNKT